MATSPTVPLCVPPHHESGLFTFPDINLSSPVSAISLSATTGSYGSPALRGAQSRSRRRDLGWNRRGFLIVEGAWTNQLPTSSSVENLFRERNAVADCVLLPRLRHSAFGFVSFELRQQPRTEIFFQETLTCSPFRQRKRRNPGNSPQSNEAARARLGIEPARESFDRGFAGRATSHGLPRHARGQADYARRRTGFN